MEDWGGGSDRRVEIAPEGWPRFPRKVDPMGWNSIRITYNIFHVQKPKMKKSRFGVDSLFILSHRAVLPDELSAPSGLSTQV